MRSLLLVFFLAAFPCSNAIAEDKPAAEKPLDEREPPYANGDFSWLNGGNRQPDSLLKWGPLTGSVFVDAYDAFQFSQPADHTIFQTTTAPRHNEIALNLVALGVEVSGLDGPIGRLYLQAGSDVETDWGQAPAPGAASSSPCGPSRRSSRRRWAGISIRCTALPPAGSQAGALAGQRLADVRPMARDERRWIPAQLQSQRAALAQPFDAACARADLFYDQTRRW